MIRTLSNALRTWLACLCALALTMSCTPANAFAEAAEIEQNVVSDSQMLPGSEVSHDASDVDLENADLEDTGGGIAAGEDEGIDHIQLLGDICELSLAGTGSAADPYLISTEADLREVAVAVNGGTATAGAYYQMQNDIELTSAWTPIGSGSTLPFTGTFDGKGHVVSGLVVNVSDTTVAAGLFGNVGADGSLSTIKNVTVRGTVTSTMGASGAGGLVGSMYNATVSNCRADVNVTATTEVGGLVGIALQSTVSGCASTGNVESTLTGSGKAGGLVGEFGSGTLENSYCIAASVYAKNIAGGLVGQWTLAYTDGVTSTIRSCYAVCAMGGYSDTRLGYLIGCVYNSYSDYAAQNFLVNCYADNGDGKGLSLVSSDYGSKAQTGATIDSASCVLSSDDMKTAAFASTLGSAFKASLAYPVLSWEAGDGLAIITMQPSDATYSIGDGASPLTIAAEKPAAGYTGEGGTLTYQWYCVSSGTVPNLQSGFGVTGATDDEKAIGEGSATERFTPPTATAGTYYYYCVVCNAFSGTSVYTASDCAVVTVQPQEDAVAPALVPSADAAITERTFSQMAAESAINVSISNSSDLADVAYQWQSSEDGLSGWQDIEGASGALTVGSDEISYAAPTGDVGETYYRCVVTNSFAGKQSQVYSGVFKITVNPVVISNATELMSFAERVAAGETFAGCDVRLGADLMLDAADGFSPIGTVEHPFKGTFDGQGHVVTLNLTDASADNQALFGYIEEATVENLIIAGAVAGAHSVAGAVAEAGPDSLVKNVGNQATVTASYADAYVDVETGTAGVVGTVRRGTIIEQCYNRASITAPCCVGGVVGYAEAYVDSSVVDPVMLRALYNTGSITSSGAAAGGVVGSLTYPFVDRSDIYTVASIDNCYNAGIVDMSAAPATTLYGAICGAGQSRQPDYSNCYYLAGCIKGAESGDQGSTQADDVSGIQSLEASAMYIKSFVDALGVDAEDANLFRMDDSDDNFGFPLLVWETPTVRPMRSLSIAIEPAGAALNVTDSLGRVKSPVSSQGGQGGAMVYEYRLASGDYSYTVDPPEGSEDDYLPTQGTIEVPQIASDDSDSLAISLVSDKYAVSFTVSDNIGATAPVQGAVVTAVHETTKRVYTFDATDVSGLTSKELLPGTYSYTVAATGHNSSTGTFTIVDGAVQKAVELASYAKLGFTVTDDQGANVTVDEGTTISVRGSETDRIMASGGVVNVPDGVLVWQVDRAGFERVIGAVKVEDGKIIASGSDADHLEPIEETSSMQFDVQLSVRDAWNGVDVQEPVQDENGAYMISCAEELAWFARYVNSNPNSNGDANYDAVLTADISLAGDGVNNAWTPIGYYLSSNDASWYAGTFDGRNHVISGLFVTGGYYQGLFGVVYGATIKNVVVSGYVAGTKYVGGLVGYTQGSFTVENCGNYAQVRGSSYVGGILGAHDDTSNAGTISGCFNKGMLSSTVTETMTGGESSLGGIVGYGYNVALNACYNIGDLTANGCNVGGIVGNAWSTTTCAYCYNTGRLIIDYDDEDYAYPDAFGGIIGGYYVTGVAVGDYCYWLNASDSFQGVTARGIGFSSAVGSPSDRTVSISSASGLVGNLNGGETLFADPTDTTFNNGYPRLWWEAEAIPSPNPEPDQDGTAEHPWVISSLEDWLNMCEQVAGGRTYQGEYLVLACSLDLSSATEFAGVGSTYLPFSGTFDGQGNTISGFTIKDQDYAGLFSYLYGGTIKNLKAVGSVSGTGFAGGLVGYASAASVQDCYVDIDVYLNQASTTVNIGAAGGVVGRGYRTSIESCLFTGTVTSGNPYARQSAICSYSSSWDMVFAANYYLTGENVPGAFSGEDAADKGEGLASFDSDELAWKLNTACGTRLNAGVWGNDNGAVFADGESVKAVYRIGVDTTGLSVSFVSGPYVHAGDLVTYSDLAPKKGYSIVGGPYVTKVTDGQDSLGDVYQGDSNSASGTFTMVSADVTFSAKTAFDESTLFDATVSVVSNDDVQRTAVVTGATSATAGTDFDIRIASVDAASRVVSVTAYECDVDKAPVDVTALGLGQWYRCSMPRADVVIVVTLGAASSGPSDYWPTDEVLSSAKHTYDANGFTSIAAYCNALLTLDSDDDACLNQIGGSYDSQWDLAIDDVEGTSLLEKYQYRGSYSVRDASGRLTTNTYQGLLLYDYLVDYWGMPDNLPDETAVTFENAQGEKTVLTIGQLRSTGYNTYVTDPSAENYGYATAEGMPVILAYAENDMPLTMDAKYVAAGNQVISYEQNTPYMLVVGQSSIDDENAGMQLFGIDHIYVGDGQASNQHWEDPYAQYQQDVVTVSVYEGDSQTPISTVDVTVKQIEEYYSEHAQAREHHVVAATQYADAGTVLGDGQVNASDLHDGVDIHSLLTSLAGLDFADLTDASADEIDVSFWSSSSSGYNEVATVPLEYLAGGASGMYADNIVDSNGYMQTGIRPFVAFSKNGRPLVYDASYSGYVDGEYNRYGPLMAVLPYNSVYGVAGSTVDVDGNAVSNDSQVVVFLCGIDIHLPAAEDDPVQDISKGSISAIADQVCTGSAITPAVTVTLDGKTLTEGSDYTLTYQNNVQVGVATVVATGTGSYTGTLRASFNIVAAPDPEPDPSEPTVQDISKGSISAIADQVCTGSAITPAVTVTLDGKTLTEGSDYTLTYQNNVQVGVATVVATGTGSYTGTLRASFNIVAAPDPEPDPSEQQASIKRLYGDEAWETSVAISKEGFESSDWVVVARSDDFADAMSATGLAGALGAPIVLTATDSLSDETAAEIKRLGAKSAYVIGGDKALLPEVVDDLRSLGLTYVDRIYGTECWDTSVACTEKLTEINQRNGESCDTAIVAMSMNFQDALSISSFAYKYHVPILLETDGETSTDRWLPEAAQDLLTSTYAGATVYVAGGSGAVSTQSVEGVVGSDNVVRMAGTTGYDTSAEIASYMTSRGLLSAETVCIACGAQPPKGVDALSGSALAGKNGGVILLVNSNEVYESVNTVTLTGFLSKNSSEVRHAFVLGGTSVVSSALYDTVKSILDATE